MGSESTPPLWQPGPWNTTIGRLMKELLKCSENLEQLNSQAADVIAELEAGSVAGAKKTANSLRTRIDELNKRVDKCIEEDDEYTSTDY